MTAYSKLIIALLFIFTLISCSKKINPSKSPVVTVTTDTAKVAASSVTKEVEVVEVNTAPTPKKAKAVFPNSITVNDAAAKKSTDGRLYYDVMGHRYWKNYKDLKYYLYNKSMYKNPDFKNPDSK
ncbi:MAG: hypothetical protein ABI266_06905 [Ginsengibacter sp.]